MSKDIKLHSGNWKNLLWLLVSVTILSLDQLTKYYASNILSLGVPLIVFYGFNLTLAHNTGAAFSLFDSYGGGQLIFFSILAVFVTGYLLYWLYSLTVKNQILLKLAIACILGGTLGNLLDRVLFGYVVDFIQVYYRDFYWPIFNVADSAITIGAVLLLVDFMRRPS